MAKKGRPKSKVSRNQFLAGEIIRQYTNFTEAHFPQALSELRKNGAVDGDLLNRFCGCLETNVANSDDARDFLNATMKGFEGAYATIESRLCAQWFFLAGLHYGVEVVAKDILRAYLLHDYINFFNAKDLIELYLSRIAEGYVGPIPRFPNDILRKVRKSKHLRSAIIHLRVVIKEWGKTHDQPPCVEDVAKEMSIAVDLLKDMASEATRMRLPVRIVKDDVGRSRLIVE